MIVVALTGLARSGKDTVADHLVAEHGFVKLSFAQPLKDMVRRLDPIVGRAGSWEWCCEDCGVEGEPGGTTGVIYLSDLNLTDEQLKDSPYYEEVRRIWQKFGTDCVRTVDENFWLNILARKLQSLPDGAKVVITDARFQNEVDMLENGHRPLPLGQVPGRHDWFGGDPYGCVTLRVERPGIVDTTGHESEKNVNSISVDDTIYNDGGIDDLRKHVDQLIREWGVK